MTIPVLLSWSSGKDSAWALHALNQSADYEVVALLSTINGVNQRVSMHGTHADILAAQAEAAGLPLLTAPIPSPCSNDEYELAMRDALATAESRWSVRHVAFGDLFLQDVRQYREERCLNAGWTPLFPLWKIPTHELALQMIHSGLQAKIACVDTRRLPITLLGREFDHALLADLPSDIDPCAENGEFHTAAYAGPMFQRPIRIDSAGVYEEAPFAWADLRLGGG